MLEANNYGGYLRWQMQPATAGRRTYTGAPTLTANAVKAMLQYSATPLRDANGAKYDALTQGSGEVNGYGALALAGCRRHRRRAAGAFWMTVSWPTDRPRSAAWTNSGRSRSSGARASSGQQPGRHQPARLGEQHRLGHRRDGQGRRARHDERRRQHRLGHAARRRQHRVGHAVRRQRGRSATTSSGARRWPGTTTSSGARAWSACSAATTSCGARCSTAPTTSCGARSRDDNIVWGTLFDDNIVWGTADKVLGLVSSIGGGL